MAQKSSVLIYFAEEAWNLEVLPLFQYKLRLNENVNAPVLLLILLRLLFFFRALFFFCVVALLWLRRRRPGFDPRPVYVGFMAEKVQMGQYFLSVRRLILSGSFHHFYVRMLHSPTADATQAHSPTTGATQANSPTTDAIPAPHIAHLFIALLKLRPNYGFQFWFINI